MTNNDKKIIEIDNKIKKIRLDIKTETKKHPSIKLLLIIIILLY